MGNSASITVEKKQHTLKNTVMSLPDKLIIFWLNMDSRELITLPVVRVACLALGTCSIGPNG
jgi:hypothetical protein